MIEIRSLTRRFPGAPQPAVDDVSFTIHRGDCAVISGANGSGKSVLMHLIADLDRPDAGTIIIDKDETGQKTRIGLVFQDASAQILGETPEEDTAFGPLNLGSTRDEARRIAADCLERTGLTEKSSWPARTLSGGEKRRLAVAGVLAMEAKVIIFDEPFANLDWPGVVQVNTIIRDLHTSGKTVIVLTHELEKVLALANRLLVLHRGRLVYDGTPEKALAEAPLEQWGIRNPLGSYHTKEDLLWE
ncbi:MAG TPA: ABC transporter ATP-binding protein [Treponemataceae bacterium]|jgi:biotin transport system ATP-binding protein|nr:MAG: Cobalt import ATP-binding protein CbiO [Spirochaetes bacterium ADurb.Bin215]HOF85286.1 ABC transporter ATP-binding protein [Treponemataceae bacterium]HOS35448.1 ABC transporter ATP-binding protein [Treponemataceae bacterium]HOU37473.1 ABC transporter ATP-binding protein [Treponemataceae bacterium]HPA09411.1 ABC transporter ATP-binding protein [Treponemataceae bacterium]